MKSNTVQKMIINTLIFIVVAIMAELFIFNFRCFTTVNEKEIVVPLEYCSYEGLKEQRDNLHNDLT